MPGRRLSFTLRTLLAAFFCSAVGSGLTMPFLLIYLHQARHISLGIAGALIGGIAVLAVPVGPLTGTLVDRIGSRTVALGALCLQAVGTASLVFVHSPASAVGPMILFGLGQGAFFPAWSALVAVLAHEEEQRPRIFALNFQLLNLGLGIGSVVAGFVVKAHDPSSFVAIYLIDGASTLLVVVALALLPRRSFRPATAGSPAAERPAEAAAAESTVATEPAPVSGGVRARGGYREVVADGRFLWYLWAGLLLATAGYGAITAGFVGFATTVVHVSPRTIAWAFGVNTFLIVATQPIALRIVGRMRRTSALMVTAGFWAASWVVLGVAGLFPSSLAGDTLTIAMFAVFAAGEVFLSPVSGPLVNDLASPELRGRYNAAASTVYSASGVICPPIAGAMLGAGLGAELLGLLFGCCGAAVWALSRLRRALSPAEDNAAEWRREQVAVDATS